MHFKIGKALNRAIVRFASLLSLYPICKQYRLAGARKVKQHKSTLHIMTQLYGIKSDTVETLPIIRLNPTEKNHLPASLEISKSKKALVQLDTNSTEVIKIYIHSSATIVRLKQWQY
jgi:hypothetical protein